MDELEARVRAALGSGDWSLVLLALDDMLAEGNAPMRTVSRYIDAVAQALTHVEPQEDIDRQVDDLSGWLYTSVDQAIFVGANPGVRFTWQTQQDERVRASHRALHGRTISAGETFDVEGTNLPYPGFPLGNPAAWYNCRCYLAVAEESLTAALRPVADLDSSDAVIVALPVDGDPVRDLGPEESHLTLAYLGEQEVSEEFETALGKYARTLSDQIEMSVQGVDQFGDETEPAQVLTLAPDVPTQVRDGVLALMQEHGLEDASTWPDYRPHVTLGYIPEGEQPEAVDAPESIAFDRLAVWRPGDMAVTFQMGSESEDVEEPEDDDLIDPPGPLMFHGIMVVEGVPTDADQGIVRTFAPNSLTWREPPLTLTFEHITDGMRTEVLGHIDRIWRLEDRPNAIAYEGAFDESDAVDVRIGQIANGSVTRVSIHTGAMEGVMAQAEEGKADSITFTTGRIAGLAVVPMPGFEDMYIALGPWPTESPTVGESEDVVLVEDEDELGEMPDALVASLGDFKRGPGWVTEPVATRRLHRYWTQPGQPGYAKIAWGTPNDFYRCRAHLAEYINPLYLNRTCAQWHHDALGIWPGQHSVGGSMTASAAPQETYKPPLEWFQNPHLLTRTPLTITNEGRVFGHLATWDMCHISYGSRQCTTPPRSATQYAFFNLGKVLTDGGEVSAGQIVLGGPHARDGVALSVAQDFYAKTSSAVADVTVGEDSIGIWFSGAIRPWATPEQLYALRAAKLSGDWRDVRGNLELCAALAVNVPGFPIPEPSLVASGDRIMSLTAAGVVIDPEEPVDTSTLVEVNEAMVKRVAREAALAVDRIQAARAAKGEFRPIRAQRAKAEMEEI